MSLKVNQIQYAAFHCNPVVCFIKPHRYPLPSYPIIKKGRQNPIAPPSTPKRSLKMAEVYCIIACKLQKHAPQRNLPLCAIDRSRSLQNTLLCDRKKLMQPCWMLHLSTADVAGLYLRLQLQLLCHISQLDRARALLRVLLPGR